MTRSRRALEALVSGCMVYGLMAACSGSKTMTTGSTTAAGGHGTGAGSTGHGGVPGSGGQSGSGGQTGNGGNTGTDPTDSGIFDALTDPVSDAMAGIENPQSGTRLKGKYTLGADGSKEYQLSTVYANYGSGIAPPVTVHAVWYDSMLQEDCSFLQATDGKLHCLPGFLAGPQTPPVYGFGVYYADAQCTKPVLVQYQPGTGCVPPTPPKYVQSQDVVACWTPAVAPTTRVFQVGSAAAQGPAYASYQPGQCGSVNPAQFGAVMGWFSAMEVPPSTFVEGATGIDP